MKRVAIFVRGMTMQVKDVDTLKKWVYSRIVEIETREELRYDLSMRRFNEGRVHELEWVLHILGA